MRQMVVSETGATHRIERIVTHSRTSVNRYAYFKVHQPLLADASWYACRVAIGKPWTEIWVEQRCLSPEHAAAMATALQMAVDWIAEETGRTEGC